MRNCNLAVKLAASFGTIILLFILLGSSALWCNSSIGGRLTELGALRIPSMQGILLMQDNIRKVVEIQRSLMLPGLPPQKREALLAEVESARAKYKQGLDLYEKLEKTPKEAQLWKEFQSELVRARDLNNQFFSLEKDFHQTNGQETYDRMLALTLGDILASNEKLFASLDAMTAQINQSAAQSLAESERDARINKLAALLGMIGGTLLAALLAVVTSRYLARNTTALARYATAVGEGNLDAPLEITARDEFGILADGLRDMVGKLKSMIQQCLLKEADAEREAQNATEAAEQARQAMNRAEARQSEMLEAAHRLERVVEGMSAATSQLSGQVQVVGRGVSTQEARTSETAAAMQQMNTSVLEVAQSASSAASQAANAKTKAEEGRDVVGRAKSAITQVNVVAEMLESGMGRLGDQAGSIGRIMNVISDIADQTNLLALNAAIEAARAGEAGRGFAVVADEVRKLAEKTMAATKEVGDSISSIQDGIHSNIDLVNQAAQAVSTATTEAAESENALHDIVGLVTGTGDQITAIATASQEQSAASEQISRAVEEVSRIASEIAQGMSEATDAMHGLAGESRELTSLIASFRKNDEGIPALN
ncbi:methyl-accepting chemotaxis protein [Fundidesulfovibrio terrae]|uniref:methyl-accepting chemotaxis protein n=1 Tax=Fundidesulfovibrio terrae TaxID=2922866 RepID=UPI001FAE7764|nr:methyl-accepting chemotaxis protein [Fundidesulfovibrio terrae]